MKKSVQLCSVQHVYSRPCVQAFFHLFGLILAIIVIGHIIIFHSPHARPHQVYTSKKNPVEITIRAGWLLRVKKLEGSKKRSGRVVVISKF